MSGALHDLVAQLRARCQHTVIAREIEVRGRHEGAQPGKEREGVEHDGLGAVGPDALELVADTAVGLDVKPLGGNGRTGHVPAETLERVAVSTVDVGAGMDVEAPHRGQRQGRGVGRQGRRRGDEA